MSMKLPGTTSKMQLRRFEFPGIVIPTATLLDLTRLVPFHTCKCFWRLHLASSFYVFMTFLVIA